MPTNLPVEPQLGIVQVGDRPIPQDAAGAVTKDIPVTFPLNVVVSVNVWTR